MYNINIIYAFFLFHSNLPKNASALDSEPNSAQVRSTMTNLLDSFKNFTENVRTYFDLPMNILGDRKDKIRKGLLKFFSNNPSALTTVTAAISSTRTPTRSSHRTFTLRLEPLRLASDMIIESGYRVETHTVQTSDAYHLVLHRIRSHSRKTGKIALLHHGLLGSSDDWLLLGPKKALPYLMSDAGYDVWLANARGNRYSKTHLRMSAESSSYEYWNFSWHEIGHYDLRATVDYIRDVTEESARIDFIGHSLGATVLLVLLTTLPQYNLMLRCAILLGPLSYMYTARGPIRYLADLLEEKGKVGLDFLGKNEFMRKEMYPSKLVEKFCTGEEELCQNPLLFLSNGGKNITDKNLKKTILNHVPAGGSSKTIVHYCQLIKSVHFQMFDLGIANNMYTYGMRSPPAYRLNDVTVPVAVFTASDDWLSTTADALSLIPNLPFALQHHIIKQQDFSHTDFVFSERATKLVYKRVLVVLDTMVPDRIGPHDRTGN